MGSIVCILFRKLLDESESGIEQISVGVFV